MAPGPWDALETWSADRAAHREAIVAFLAVDRPLPDDVDTCLAYAHLAVAAAGYTDPAPSDTDRRRYLRTSVEAAERTLERAPDRADSHCWFAVCRALELDAQGPLSRLRGIGRVRRSATRTSSRPSPPTAAPPRRPCPTARRPRRT